MTQYRAKKEYDITYKLGSRTITQRLTFLSFSETSNFAIFENPVKHINKIAISGKLIKDADSKEGVKRKYFYQDKQVETIAIPLCNIIDTAHRG